MCVYAHKASQACLHRYVHAAVCTMHWNCEHISAQLYSLAHLHLPAMEMSSCPTVMRQYVLSCMHVPGLLSIPLGACVHLQRSRSGNCECGRNTRRCLRNSEGVWGCWGGAVAPCCTPCHACGPQLAFAWLLEVQG